MAMYPLSVLEDNTQIMYSNIQEVDGIKSVYIHFERPTKDGFDSVRCKLPNYEWTIWEGCYSDEEMEVFEHMVRDGAHVFYELAEIGGYDFANAV